MAYLLNDINLTVYGITAGHFPGGNISLQGCFDLPKRKGTTHYVWDDDNTIEPYTDADEIFFEGRDIVFHGTIIGTIAATNTYLTALYNAIDAFTDLVTFSTPYGDFPVKVSSVRPIFYNGACAVIITFREPVAVLSGGTLPAEAVNDYTIDGIPMSSFGLYYSKGDGQNSLPEPKEQYVTGYAAEGYRITKHKEKVFEFDGFIQASSLSDFQDKIKNLYLLFSQAGLRDINLDGNHIIGFAADGFKVDNVIMPGEVSGTAPVFVSAAVANATPTKVILTYDQDLAGGNISCFTITDHTISNFVIVGSTVELTLSTPVIYFDVLYVTYTGGATPLTGLVGGISAADLASTLITNNVLVTGNEVGWWLASDLATITKDGSNLVSRWNDKLASGRDLLQATGTNQPLWSASGILFDGVDNFMKCEPFVWGQPNFTILVFKQITWTVSDNIIDGHTTNHGKLQQVTATPTIWAYAGAGTAANSVNPPVDTLVIIRVLFNEASSKLILNNDAPVTGNFGTNTRDGFILGARPSGTHPLANGQFSHIEVAEIIGLNVAPSSDYETSLYNVVKRRNGL